MSAMPIASGSSGVGPSFTSLLQKLPFLGEISESQIAHLRSFGRVLSVDADQVVFRAGDQADCMCVILSGEVHLFLDGAEGQRWMAAHLGKGDFFGEMALLDGGTRSVTVESEMPCELLTLDRQGFLELLSVSRESLSALLHYLMGNVGTTNFEAELSRRELRLEMETERYRSLAQMVAGVAHEVNTPLGIINTASSIIQRELASGAFSEVAATRAGKMALETVLEAVDLVQRNITRAHSLVRSFKSISVSQISDTKESMNLTEAIEEVLDLFKINARQAKLQVELKSSLMDRSGTWVGYRGHLSRVILNLLTNVERYAYPDGGGGKVEICLAADDKCRPPCFQITVRDFGKGIAPENLPRIFDPFFTTGRAKGGTGLGMAIVYNLVTAALQGSIALESEPGRGTSVQVTVPQAVA